MTRPPVRPSYRLLLVAVLLAGIILIVFAEVLNAVALGVLGGSLIGCVTLRTLQLLDPS